MKKIVALIPFGRVQAELLSWLAARLPEVIPRVVTVGEARPLPQSGFDVRRGQYRGQAILAALHALQIQDAERLMGIVEADCYTSGLNFIFGQATLGGRDAFVALPRLRQGFYGLPEDQDLFQERALKEVVHELGHTWSLDHCPRSSCVMHFSNMLHDTDVKGYAFCARCREKLG